MDTITVEPYHRFLVPLNNDEQTNICRKVLFHIKCTKNDDDKKHNKDRHICLVLDISGSMVGEPLQFLKIAACGILDHFGIHNMTIIVYSNQARLLCHSTVDDMKTAIKRLEASGQTNMLHALQLAHVMCKVRDNSRILLFTDGHATINTKSCPSKYTIYNEVDDIYKHNINVTCFGVGRNYDEQLLETISSKGAGEYFFIDGPHVIEPVVKEAISHIEQLVAKNVLFTIYNNNDSNNILYKKLLGDLHVGFPRDILFDAVINISSNHKKGDQIHFIRWTLTGQCNDDENFKQSGTCFVICTEDMDNIIEQEPYQVTEATLIQQVTQTMELVSKALKQRDYKTAETLQDKIINDLETSSLHTQKISAVLKRAKKTRKMIQLQQHKRANKYLSHTSCATSNGYSGHYIDMTDILDE